MGKLNILVQPIICCVISYLLILCIAFSSAGIAQERKIIKETSEKTVKENENSIPIPSFFCNKENTKVIIYDLLLIIYSSRARSQILLYEICTI